MQIPDIKISIITIFPELFPGILDYSITGNAIRNKKCIIDIYDLKEFGIGKHRKIDDKIYGGGSGMLIKPDVLSKALDVAISKYKNPNIIYTSPRGYLYNQQKAHQLSKYKEMIIICGRFEGIDQRVIEKYSIEEISIGDYILTNGEIAAFNIIDSVIRLIPDVISKDSLLEESFGQNTQYENLIEYPQYTKPYDWENIKVPEILLSGNHFKIKNWNLEKSEEYTKSKREDLWKKYLEDHKKH